MKNIIIFGADSFTGRKFIDYIINVELGVRIVGVDIAFSTTQNLFKYYQIEEYSSGSIDDILNENEADYIINFCGVFGSNNNYGKMEYVNYRIPKLILDSIDDLKYPLKKILLIGSAAEYGIPLYLPIDESHPIRPVSNYGFTKAMQTNYVRYLQRVSHIPILLVRPFNLIGSGMSSSLVVQAFIERIKKTSDGSIVVGNIESKRDFLSIDDAIKAYWNLLECEYAMGEFNICSGNSVPIREVLEMIITKSNKKIKWIPDHALFNRYDVPEIFGSATRVKVMTGWKPEEKLEETIDKMWNYS